MNCLSLEGCVVESVVDLKQKGRKYFIYRSDGKMLHRLERHLELFANFGMEDLWTEAFKEIGIFQDMSSSNQSINSDKVKPCVQNYCQQSFRFS